MAEAIRPYALFLIGVGADVGPELPQFLLAQHVLPRRHLVLAVAHRALEARPVTRGEPAQIESLPGAHQAVAMAGLAIVTVDRLAGFDRRLPLRGDLRSGGGRERHRGDGERQPPILPGSPRHSSYSAKVHNETPVGAFSSAGSPARWA